MLRIKTTTVPFTVGGILEFHAAPSPPPPPPPPHTHTHLFVWLSFGAGKPHPDPDHPDYVPSINVDGKHKERQMYKVERYDRLKRRRLSVHVLHEVTNTRRNTPERQAENGAKVCSERQIENGAKVCSKRQIENETEVCSETQIENETEVCSERQIEKETGVQKYLFPSQSVFRCTPLFHSQSVFRCTLLFHSQSVFCCTPLLHFQSVFCCTPLLHFQSVFRCTPLLHSQLVSLEYFCVCWLLHAEHEHSVFAFSIYHIAQLCTFVFPWVPHPPDASDVISTEWGRRHILDIIPTPFHLGKKIAYHSRSDWKLLFSLM